MSDTDADTGELQLVPMPQTRDDLGELVSKLRQLTNATDNIEVVRKRRIARVNAAADERLAPLTAQVKAIVETILVAAGAQWDEFNKGASAPLTMEFSEGVLKRNDGKVGKLVVEDLETALAFLEALPEPDKYVKTTKDVKKVPVKEWLDENTDRRVPGTRVTHTKTVTLKIEPSPVAQQVGAKSHEFTREVT